MNFRQNFRSIIWLGIKFGIIGGLLGLVLHDYWKNPQTFIYTVVIGFIIGFFVGIIEPIFSKSKINKLPYSFILLIRAFIYFLISIISVAAVLFSYLKITGFNLQDLGNPQKLELIKNNYFLTNLNILTILVIIFIATFVWQLNSFFGKGVLINYLSGKYHKPIVEERIFMFLDLNDATTIAEKLGSEKFSSFLRDFFNDIDIAITTSKGEVYQYVGDEIVVIWNTKYGLKDNNCISAFYSAVESIKSKEEYYKQNYGVIPNFKASFHIGEVTITEVGSSKKEIAYHGDTINTASRICSLAGTLKTNLLISKTLYEKLDLNSSIKLIDLGKHSLKGKEEVIHVYGK